VSAFTLVFLLGLKTFVYAGLV